MAKKDWKKINSNVYRKGMTALIITGYGLTFTTHYAVRIFHDAGWTSEKLVVNKHFKTKPQALKFAEKYMRKN